MSAYEKECFHCGGKEHASEDCPHSVFSDKKCFRCGSVEHATEDCPHSVFSDKKCFRCGSVEHATEDCPHNVFSDKKCFRCGSIEHATNDCPHSVFSDKKCFRCGSLEHTTNDCPHSVFSFSGFPGKHKKVKNDDDDENDWVIGCVAKLIGVMVVVFVIVWLAVNVALPLLLLDSALILTMLSAKSEKRKISLAILAYLGGFYFLYDGIHGIFSALFVENVVKSWMWIRVLLFINTVALGYNTWLLYKLIITWSANPGIKKIDHSWILVSKIGIGLSILLAVAVFYYLALAQFTWSMYFLPFAIPLMGFGILLFFLITVAKSGSKDFIGINYFHERHIKATIPKIGNYNHLNTPSTPENLVHEPIKAQPNRRFHDLGITEKVKTDSQNRSIEFIKQDESKLKHTPPVSIPEVYQRLNRNQTKPLDVLQNIKMKNYPNSYIKGLISGVIGTLAFLCLAAGIFYWIHRNDIGWKNNLLTSLSPINDTSGKKSSFESFYMINVDAVTSEKVAKKKVAELIHNGYHADYLWIPDYASLTGLKAFAVYIGPYTNQHDCEVATEKYRLNNPDAYGLLVSKKKERVEIYGVGIVDEIPNWRGNEDDSTIK